jgi:ABC-type transport system involved in multi-copper enzyme maturation permease subunit
LTRRSLPSVIMTFLPIVERELRFRARRSQTHRLRAGMGLAAILVALGTITLGGGGGRNPGQTGVEVFWMLSVAAFVVCLFAGPLLAADSLSLEKREGTLQLLFLTDLRGYDIVLGKLAAAALPAVYALLAVMPILGLSFLLGGVTGGEFQRVNTTLLVTIFFSLAVALFVSAISLDGRRAMLGSGLLLLVTAAAPWLMRTLGPEPTTTLTVAISNLPSPWMALEMASDDRYPGEAAVYWRILATLFALSIGLLFLASLVLPRSLREKAIPARPGVGSTRHHRQAADAESSRRRRQWLLEKNPVLWLARSTSGETWSTTGIWLLGFALWVCGFVASRHNPAAVPILFLTLYGLHTAIKCWIAWEASRRFAEDRRTGSLELLLTTPLGERRILSGWLLGMKRKCLVPVLMLLAMDLAFWSAAPSGAWQLAVLGTAALFLADAYTLCWVGLWVGLTASNSVQGFTKTIGYVLCLPWLTFFTFLAVTGLALTGTVLPNQPAWLAVAWVLFCLFFDLTLTAWSIGKLSDRFRTVAAVGST